MEKHEVYVVVSGRHYENGEEYFGCDGIFNTLPDAEKYVQKDLSDTLSGYEVDSFEIEVEDLLVRAIQIDGADEFFWEISTHELE